jgi:hypothetical protein
VEEKPNHTRKPGPLLHHSILSGHLLFLVV